MAKLILFNKPYLVLSQFSDPEERTTLRQFIDTTGFYPAGRLDYDSEGLLLLTDDGALQHRISHPSQKMAKTYWVQVEGSIDEAALNALRQGVELNDGLTRPAKAEKMAPPDVWDRNPPVRFRRDIPTSWLSLTISEGRNRQVRRMTAQVGFPTLRLIRYSIGPWTLSGIAPGESRCEEINLPSTREHSRNFRQSKQQYASSRPRDDSKRHRATNRKPS